MSPHAAARPVGTGTAPAHGIVAQTDGLTSLALTNSDIPFTDAELNAYVAWEGSVAWPSTHVVAVFASGSASFTVNGGSPVVLASGVASPDVVLSQGVNAAESTTTIVVTHVAGGVSTSYTVRVYRHAWAAGTPVSVTAGGVPLELTPVATTDAGERRWTVTVPYTTTQVVARWQGYGSYRLQDCAWRNFSPGVLMDATCPKDLNVGTTGAWFGYRPYAVNEGHLSSYNVDIVRASQFAAVASIDLDGDDVSDDSVPSGSTMEAVVELTGIPAPTATYQWQEADAAPDVTLRGMLATPSIGTQSVVWTDIAGADTSLFTPAAAQVGKYVRVKITASNGFSEPQVSASTPRQVIQGAVPTPAQPQSPDPVSAGGNASSAPSELPYSPAPGITLGETRGEAVLAASVPAAGADLLRGANIWVRPTSKVEYLASSLPDGLKLVDGKLVASKPGTYKVKIKVKRANGTSVVRTIKIKVG
jgi:hypothetical protein